MYDSLGITRTTNLRNILHTSCYPTLQHHNSYNRTDNYRQWNAVGSPDDGHKHVEILLITNKSLFVTSSWSHVYLLQNTRLTHKRFEPEGVRSSIIDVTQLLRKAIHFDS